MYLRTTRRRNDDGSEVGYLSLAHNEWDPVARRSTVRILFNFGRQDELDPAAIRRLIGSLSRALPGGEALAAAMPSELRYLESRPLGGAHLLDGLWHRLGLHEILARRGSARPMDRAAARAAGEPSSPIFQQSATLSGGVAFTNPATLNQVGTYHWSAYYRPADNRNNPVSRTCSEPVTLTGAESTPSPTPTSTPTPTPAPTPTTEGTPSATPTGSAGPATSGPSGSAMPETTVSGSEGSSGGSLPIILLVLMAGSLGLFLVSPLPKRIRRQ